MVSIIKKWIHIDFYFKADDFQHRKSRYLGPKQLKVFRKYLVDIVSLFPVYRKFYLFEPKPHCFLALELSLPANEKLAAGAYREMIDRILKLSKPKFVRDMFLNPKSHDETNGEAFLNFMNGAWDVARYTDRKFYPPWLKDHPADLRLLMHCVHCLLNSSLNSRPEELRFYLNMYGKYVGGLLAKKSDVKKWEKISNAIRDLCS